MKMNNNYILQGHMSGRHWLGDRTKLLIVYREVVDHRDGTTPLPSPLKLLVLTSSSQWMVNICRIVLMTLMRGLNMTMLL